MTNTVEEIKALADFLGESTTLTQSACYRLAEKILNSGLVLPSPSVVSPLVWEGNTLIKLKAKVISANTLIVAYWIEERKEGDFMLHATFGDGLNLPFETLEHAKQAAQNHFTTLIGSCLQGGGYTEEQIQHAYESGWYEGYERESYDYLNEDFKRYLSSLKQQP